MKHVGQAWDEARCSMCSGGKGTASQPQVDRVFVKLLYKRCNHESMDITRFTVKSVTNVLLG